MAIIQIRNFSFSYEKGKKVLEKINLDIEEGSFNVLCGLTGSGKTTLLNELKPQIRLIGIRSGEILYEGESIDHIPKEKMVSEIGFVFQDSDAQIVTEQVMHELAFGLENMSYSVSEMQKRIGEMVSFFGLSHLLHKSIKELSGGEKQIVNLAAVLVLRPKVLILDEPLAQLDPVMAENLTNMLRRINEEMGMTIIISEHRLELLMGMADQVIVLEEGKIKVNGDCREVCASLYEEPCFRYFVPSVARLYLQYEVSKVPLSVKEAKAWARQYQWGEADSSERFQRTTNDEAARLIENSLDDLIGSNSGDEVLLSCKEVYFAYSRYEEDVLKRISFEIKQGDYTILVGANGCGKSTLLKVAAGLCEPQRGKVLWQGKTLKKWGHKKWSDKMGYLAQNPKLYLNEETVEKVIESNKRYLEMVDEAYIIELLALFELEDKLLQHPYDLSGGEQQRLALLTVLMRKPQLLLLDEPTKGMDPYSKETFARHLEVLHQSGMTILLVTHDLEFAARHGEEGMMLFDGDLTGHMPIKSLLNENFFYTTPISKVMRGLVSEAVLCEEEVVRHD